MKNFMGEATLLNYFNEFAKDPLMPYRKGEGVCFAGSHGVGKTTVCANILKTATLKGYNGLYTTLLDMIHILTASSNEIKYAARREFMTVDFLVIDEFDPRFISSDTAADFFGILLESIFRTRMQNKLPLYMCTNSPNVLQAFRGTIKASLDSLMNGYIKIIPILGPDFRSKGK